MEIIGVIDSSGSMSHCWKTMAEYWNSFISPMNPKVICFDTNLHIANSSSLSSNINDHGGNSTNIYKPFEKIDSLLRGEY